MKHEIGNRHKLLREQVLKQTVAEYAASMGVKEVTVYSWESGRTSVPQKVIEMLERRHGISAGWIVTGRSSMISDSAPSAWERAVNHLSALGTLLEELKRDSPAVISGGSRKGASGTRIPMLSIGVSAGMPVAAEDTVERDIDLSEMLLKHPESTYIIRTVGDSMTGAGISDGDALIVDCAITPKPGQIVIARVYGELTVKRYMQTDHGPVLRAENKRHRDIEVNEEMDFTIVGVVTSCIKQF